MEGGAQARRRRLVERGTDRLAFITGQARNIPADSFPASPLRSEVPEIHSKYQPNEGGLSGERSHRDPFGRSEQSTEVHEARPSDEVPKEKPKDKALGDEGDMLPKVKPSSEVPEIQPVNETLVDGRGEQILVRQTGDSAGAKVQPRRRESETMTGSDALRQSNQPSAAWSVEVLKEHLNFSPQQVRQAISASENNRLLTSFVVACLVVLSNWGLTIGGAVTRGIVGTRPLLFLILTNVTIVFGLLMAHKDANKKEHEKASAAGGGNLGSADSIGQMLDMGLLLQKALGALFMDCSICAVVMICFCGF